MTTTEIGRRLPRIEDQRLLTGRGRYLADIVLPRMLDVAFFRSSVPHASIESISYDAAFGIDGVETVLTARDLPDIEMKSTRHPAMVATPQRPLADTKVRFVGEPIAMAIAETRYLAEDALDHIQVGYRELPPVTEVGEHDENTVALFDEIPDNVVFRDSMDFGDSSAAFGRAAHIVTKTVRLAKQTACPLETRGCIADFDPATKHLTIYASTQAPHRLQRDLAKALQIPEHTVTVVMHDIGGGFGQKIPTHMEDIAVAAAAMLLGRPIRWIEDRSESLVAAPQARGTQVRAELALDENLAFIGIRADIIGDSGAYSSNSTSPLTESYRTARAIPGPYPIENYSYNLRINVTNTTPIGAYRGVGFVTAQLIRELLIDEAARVLDCDPFELRRKNMIRPDQLPYRTCTGWTLNEASFVESFEAAQELLAEWLQQEDQNADQAHDRTVLRGIGVCPFIEPSGTAGRGTAEVHGLPSTSHDAARVVIDTSGTVTVSFGTPSLGQGLETSMAQVTADAIGIPVEDVRVRWTDTSQAPVSLTGTRASRAAAVTGGALARAGRKVREQILEVATKILEVDAKDLTLERGVVSVIGVPDRQMSAVDVVRAAFFDPAVTSFEHEYTFEATERYDPPATYSNACVIAVVDIDPDTGAVDVKNILSVEDCGRVINPMIVEGQFIGGAAQAIGSVLYEAVRYGSDGQPTTSTLMDYLLPTAHDVPRMTTHHIETPAEKNEFGIKGVGESGVIGTVAALACAVMNALGDRAPDSCDLPMTASRIWSALQEN